MANFLKHIPCVRCGSSDAGSFYDDGSTYCFSCETWGREKSTQSYSSSSSTTKNLLTGTYSEITSRKLKEDTCRKYSYQIGEINGEKCHIANYRDSNGSIVAQKIRQTGKQFSILGNGKNLPLFGQHLFAGGKAVVVTEGELDALSVSQAFDNKWPAVSIPNGAQGAIKSLSNAYEWLDSFDRIILCFDQDEPGRKATQECAEVLPVGKVYIMTLPRKDASEVLMEDGTAPIVTAFWNAKPWRPDGILMGNELTRERLKKTSVQGYSLPYKRVSEMLGGIRMREITLLTAGSGIGKSTFAREIAYHLHQAHGLTIGNIFLEESVEKTGQGYVAIHNNVKLGALRADPSILTDAQWDEALESVIHHRMLFYNHFGSLDSKKLIAKMRYMRQVLGVDFIILDHISIVVSGQSSSSEGERKDIDILMTNLRSLCEETGVGIIAIVHLSQPDGKPHEEGGRVTLRHLRGSGSLKQLSDTVIALERDQQDASTKDECLIRVLKSRELGELGEADTLTYSHETGRLFASDPFSNEDNIDKEHEEDRHL